MYHTQPDCALPLQDKSIRIICVDDHPVVRRGLISLIRSEPGMEVIGEAGSAEEALSLCLSLVPDVVLMDLKMKGMNGAEAIEALKKQKPAIRCLVLTTYIHDEAIRRALDAGAEGYLLKSEPDHVLMRSIREVHAGRRVIPGDVAQGLAASLTLSALTQREFNVLECLALGQSNKQIARALGIGEGTVRTHVQNILAKFGCADRTAAVIHAVNRGLVGPEAMGPSKPDKSG